jgi:hypothetical protein
MGKVAETLLHPAALGDVLMCGDPPATLARLIDDVDASAVTEFAHRGVGAALLEIGEQHTVILLRRGLPRCATVPVKFQNLAERGTRAGKLERQSIHLCVAPVGDDEALVGIVHRDAVMHRVQRRRELGLRRPPVHCFPLELLAAETQESYRDDAKHGEGGEHLVELPFAMPFVEGHELLECVDPDHQEEHHTTKGDRCEMAMPTGLGYSVDCTRCKIAITPEHAHQSPQPSRRWTHASGRSAVTIRPSRSANTDGHHGRLCAKSNKNRWKGSLNFQSALPWRPSGPHAKRSAASGVSTTFAVVCCSLP